MIWRSEVYGMLILQCSLVTQLHVLGSTVATNLDISLGLNLNAEPVKFPRKTTKSARKMRFFDTFIMQPSKTTIMTQRSKIVGLDPTAQRVFPILQSRTPPPTRAHAPQPFRLLCPAHWGKIISEIAF